MPCRHWRKVNIARYSRNIQVEQYDIRMYAYALMTNHYHFLFETLMTRLDERLKKSRKLKKKLKDLRVECGLNH